MLLALIAFAGGGLLGDGRRRAQGQPEPPVFNWVAQGYIQFFQGTPLLIQLFMVFYGTAFIGLSPIPGAPPR